MPSECSPTHLSEQYIKCVSFVALCTVYLHCLCSPFHWNLCAVHVSAVFPSVPKQIPQSAECGRKIKYDQLGHFQPLTITGIQRDIYWGGGDCVAFKNADCLDTDTFCWTSNLWPGSLILHQFMLFGSYLVGCLFFPHCSVFTSFTDRTQILSYKWLHTQNHSPVSVNAHWHRKTDLWSSALLGKCAQRQT